MTGLDVRWRRWKEAYDKVVKEWNIEAANWRAQLERLTAERDEAVRIATALIESMNPAEQEVAIAALHQRADELNEEAEFEFDEYVAELEQETETIPSERTIRWEDR